MGVIPHLSFRDHGSQDVKHEQNKTEKI